MRKTLLVIEPNEDTRANFYQDIGEKTQMNVIFAQDGVMAYQKSRNQNFDVIVTEWVVPKIKELQLIASLRETTPNGETPIVIYTEALENARLQCAKMNMLFYQERPVDIDSLVKKIKEALNFDPNKKRFKLDVNFINPFIEMSVKTLEGLCAMEGIESHKPYLLNDNEDLDIDISGTLAITSPYFHGSIAISFSNNIYKDVVSRMISENVAEINLDNQDGAAEIINIIFGNTKAVLNQRGLELNRAIPSVVRGHNHKIYNNSKIPVLLVPFDSNLGRFYIQICVKAI